MADVEMKQASATTAPEDKTKEEEPKQVTPPSALFEIRSNLSLVERAVSTLEPRFTTRVLRSLASLRRRVNGQILIEAIAAAYPKESSVKKALLGVLPPPETDMDAEPSQTVAKSPTSDPIPEIEVYLRLLIIHYLLDSPETRVKATQFGHETVEKIQQMNRRSMDALTARVFVALGRAYEIDGELSDLRPLLLSAQRTAALRHDEETEAALINLLLRNYLHYNLYSQADKLVSKTKFPESAGNPQLARYLFYVGRIRAVQLSYTAAHDHLQQAIRRAPVPTQAPGFFQAVHKFFMVVELLMGDIPERNLFRHPILEKTCAGYLEIVKSVRTGSLSQFQSTLSSYSEQFSKDKTFTLILRLRQNVIKTGIRRLSLSYSRISLRDICVKLNLDSEEDAEYIVGKAIRDGVIEGRLVHEQGWLECGVNKGQYGPEVSEVFAKRIGYCLELHNESVKAMRYPLNAHRKELQAAEGAREREKELAKEIAEGEIDENDDQMGGL